MDLSTNIIQNVYNIGTSSCDAGTKYCAEDYTLYFPCLKNITKGQNVCFDFYIADGNTQDVVDLRTVESISLNLNGQFNCTYGTFSYPDNIYSLQTEKYPVVYINDFGDRKLCNLSLFMLDVDNTGSEAYYNTKEESFYSGTEVEIAAYDTPTHIFMGWATLNVDDEDCPDADWDYLSTSNVYRFVITEDTVILALYRPRKKYSVISASTTSHFVVDYDHREYRLSNKRDEELFDDIEDDEWIQFDSLNDVLEGYKMVVKCMPSTDTMGPNPPDEMFRFVKWKDGNTSRCRLFTIGKDTKIFEDENGDTLKLNAICDGPVPYEELPDETIIYSNDFDEEGIHINTEPHIEDIYDFYGDGEHIKSANEVYQKFIGPLGYLYFNSGSLVMSSEGIENGIKINIDAQAESCELEMRVNGYTIKQEISTETFKAYEFFFTKCNKSDIEIIIDGECLIDKIEIYKEELIDAGKAQFCLDSATTSKIPSGPLNVNGAIAVGQLGVDESGNLIVENPQAYGLNTTTIGNVNKIPKITINNN